MDRDALAALDAERDQPETEGADALGVVGPGVLAPNAVALLAQRDVRGRRAGALAEEGGERRGLTQDATSSAPRYARTTAGSRWTSAAIPSAIFRPKSSAITRSAMSMTTPIS